MAVLPLFIESMDKLKSLMRLSGAKQTDALAMIDSSVQNARGYIYSVLTASRVAELVGIAYVENPTTDDGALRLRANRLEECLVKLDLLRSLPVAFIDNGGAARETWNQEGIVRREEAARKDEIQRLQDEIGGLVIALLPVDPASDDSAGGVRANCFGPTGPILVPGSTVFNNRGALGGCF